MPHRFILILSTLAIRGISTIDEIDYWIGDSIEQLVANIDTTVKSIEDAASDLRDDLINLNTTDQFIVVHSTLCQCNPHTNDGSRVKSIQSTSGKSTFLIYRTGYSDARYQLDNKYKKDAAYRILNHCNPSHDAFAPFPPFLEVPFAALLQPCDAMDPSKFFSSIYNWLYNPTPYSAVADTGNITNGPGWWIKGSDFREKYYSHRNDLPEKFDDSLLVLGN